MQLPNILSTLAIASLVSALPPRPTQLPQTDLRFMEFWWVRGFANPNCEGAELWTYSQRFETQCHSLPARAASYFAAATQNTEFRAYQEPNACVIRNGPSQLSVKDTLSEGDDFQYACFNTPVHALEVVIPK